MITQRDGLKVELGYSLPVQLMQAGFSSELIESFSNNFNELDEERGRFSFLRSLSRRLVAPFAENIYDTRVIALIGSSGSGKTTLAAKIAACCAETAKFDTLVLVSVTETSSQSTDDLKAFGRLLNMPVKQVGIKSIPNLLKEKGTQYILDISMETSKTIKFLEEATNLFLHQNLRLFKH